MKKIIVFAVLLLCSIMLQAQSETLKPGLYAMKNECLVPLKFSHSVSTVEGRNTMGTEIVYETYRFRGLSSGIEASGTFILVIDPKKKEVVKKFSEYNPFIKNIKPSRMTIVPLKINTQKQCREYCPGMKLEGLNVEGRDEMEFDWKAIGTGIYQIEVHNLKAGEYAIFFTTSKINGPDFTAMFGFTISDPNQVKTF